MKICELELDLLDLCMDELFRMCNFEFHTNDDTLYKKKIHYFYHFTFCAIY